MREKRLGDSILSVLAEILKRCKAASERLGYPGEGGERQFRGWLVSDLLATVLGWPTASIPVGERFDLILQDADGFPVATIETKTPYKKITTKERKDFEDRLSAYGTLRTAFITNGVEWERLEIAVPGGTLEIRSREKLNVSAATEEEAEAFFSPITADRFFPGAPRTSRHIVRKDSQHILEALASDLDASIRELASFLANLFADYRQGKAGKTVHDLTMSLFDLWCEKSLIVSPRLARLQLLEFFRKADRKGSDIGKLLSELGLEDAGGVADVLSSLSERQRHDPVMIENAIRPAYANAEVKLAAQTAHVLVARALLYRVGEDQEVFNRLLSGPELAKAFTPPAGSVVESPGPATELLSKIQTSLQEVLPAVYKLGEFDWWLVTPEKRAIMKASERAWLRGAAAGFERVLQRVLRVLDGYSFAHVDVDVWRNVYQHYLPADERQRLGGFYTPDELVNLVLDSVGFTADTSGLCRLRFIDPACGSGAFVTGALGRLLAHLNTRAECHSDSAAGREADWKRSERVLQIVARNLHAVDLHPFAAFLTTINVLFLVMPHYVKVRERNPDFTFDVQVFSADSLEKRDEDLVAPELFAALNSRVQLSEDSFKRYRQMLRLKFDRVFGNPPWGGVLKGDLAPVYDELKKSRYAKEYPNSAQGKYDIYGLFIERALGIVEEGGRFGLITQDTYLDKAWAAGLRKLLVSESRPRLIVSLNPFGQLFFGRMNTPCVTVVDRMAAQSSDEVRTIICAQPTQLKTVPAERRRRHVINLVRSALEDLDAGARASSKEFIQAQRVTVGQLREAAATRWTLKPTSRRRKPTLTAADILEVRQGVTPGAALDIFLLSAKRAKELGFEAALVRRAIKSKELNRWRSNWSGRVLLYPYHVIDGDAVPAFTLGMVRDEAVRTAVRGSGLNDVLDFSRQLDRDEEAIVRGRGANQRTVRDLLRHRIGLGLVRYPRIAEYLVDHYEVLEGRVFEKKRFTHGGKLWYEYHRPRDPELMLSSLRILSPTLVKRVTFALDLEGHLSDHACLFLQPTGSTTRGHEALKSALSAALGRDATRDELLKYCLAFLNSDYAQKILTGDHQPTPKGFYGVTEEFLGEIEIAPPRERKVTERLLEYVGDLVAGGGDQPSETEARLNEVVFRLVGEDPPSNVA